MYVWQPKGWTTKQENMAKFFLHLKLPKSNLESLTPSIMNHNFIMLRVCFGFNPQIQISSFNIKTIPTINNAKQNPLSIFQGTKNK